MAHGWLICHKRQPNAPYTPYSNYYVRVCAMRLQVVYPPLLDIISIAHILTPLTYLMKACFRGDPRLTAALLSTSIQYWSLGARRRSYYVFDLTLRSGKPGWVKG